MRGSEIEWRQGDMLSDEHALAMSLVDAPESNLRAVIISHDCDLTNAAEPFVEVIIGSLVASVNPELAKAKHPRELHLTFATDAENALHVELRHSDRRLVDKKRFLSTAARNAKTVLSDDEKRALKQWLAARYGRPAFPTSFERRLRKTVGNRTVDKQIGKILAPIAKNLVALFFDLGEERVAELDEGTPYFLSISVVYDATEGARNGREHAERAAAEIRLLFQKAYGTADVASEIALDRCEAVADTVMTLADLRRVDQWRLEYISLCEDPPGDFLAAGKLPV